MGTGPSVVILHSPKVSSVATPDSRPGIKRPKKSLREPSREASQGKAPSGEHSPARKPSFGTVYQGVLNKTLGVGEVPDALVHGSRRKDEVTLLSPQDVPKGKAGRKKGEDPSSSPLLSGTPDQPALPPIPQGEHSRTRKSPLTSAQVLWGPLPRKQVPVPENLSLPGERSALRGVGGPASAPPEEAAVSPPTDRTLAENMPLETKTAPAPPGKPLSDSGSKGTHGEGDQRPGEKARSPVPDFVRTVPFKGGGDFSVPGSLKTTASTDLPRSPAGSGDGRASASQGSDSGSAVAAPSGFSIPPPDGGMAGSFSGPSAVSQTNDRTQPVIPPGLPVRVSDLAKGGGGEVSLEVKPPHLGPVGVRVRIDPHTRLVSVELSSHDSRIRHLLSGKEESIKDSLSQSGFVLDRFQVASSNAPVMSSGQDPGALGITGMGSDVHRDPTGGDGTGGSDSGAFQAGTSGQEAGNFSRQGAPGAMGQEGGSGGFPGRDRIDPSREGSLTGDPSSFPGVDASAVTTENGFHRIA